MSENMGKEKLKPEAIEAAQKFLSEHFGAKPDADFDGGLSVTHQRGWILDAKGKGWKLSEILAAYAGAVQG